MKLIYISDINTFKKSFIFELVLIDKFSEFIVIQDAVTNKEQTMELYL